MNESRATHKHTTIWIGEESPLSSLWYSTDGNMDYIEMKKKFKNSHEGIAKIVKLWISLFCELITSSYEF
jgi:hypothetical protein